MRHWVRWSILSLLVAVSALFGTATSARAAVAPARCNGDVTDQLQGRLQQLQAHPPDANGYDTRFAALQALMRDANQEQEILNAVCGSSTQQFKEHKVALGAIRARARMLQAAMTPLRFGTCTGLKDIAAGFLADAWYELAEVVPKNGATPPPIAALIPSLQAKATADGLTLPALADATSYWVTTVESKGKQAVIDCAAAQ
jgi:hypothetical protein